ncbi:MAG TPA: alpha/beta hydrolase-fold protein [Phycisphaerales bacterium]|nr:alpha/beta hydrolase-fold protein [Phycisphaerales bacterium]
MKLKRHIHRLLALTLLQVFLLCTSAAHAITFTVTYDPSVTDTFTGRVYVMLSSSQRMEPRNGPTWFGTEPFYAMDVKDWLPDTPLVFDDRAVSYPGPMSKLEKKTWSAQAVMRINKDSPSIGDGTGTGYSVAVREEMEGAQAETVPLRISRVVVARPFPSNDRVVEAVCRSTLLSDFHGRDMYMRAAVILPKGATKKANEDSQRTYPALYWIGGFGSDHTSFAWMQRAWEATGFSDSIIRVVLDPSCYGGHSVFADSANNGPVGEALVKEFIPYLEEHFPLTPDANSRFLSGHSSGGWSSLWLQITYPQEFGGTWSVAPDPVDFRDFQRINLYAPGVNMYRDEQGNRRALARSGDQVLAWYDDFVAMEKVYGEGGQIRSFEWVFSPRGDDGLPMKMFDRETGAVNPAVAEAWKKYDIQLILRDRWKELGPQLKGKLHIFMGDVDTFYLDGATKLLKHTLEELGSDAVVDIEPGKDHMTIATRALQRRTDEELLKWYREHHPKAAASQPVSEPVGAGAD